MRNARTRLAAPARSGPEVTHSPAARTVGVGVGIVLLLCTALGMTGCNAAGYAFYLRVDDLKPLFVTIVDQSGSMNSFQAGIRALIEDSREQFLTKVYGDDEAGMNELYFIVPWGSGESWPEAFTSEPSALMPDTAAQLIFANERVASMNEEEYASFVETLDAYPVRVYLFYGNGGAPNYDATMLQDYISGTSAEVFFSRCALVGVPGSDTPFIDGATAVIEEGVLEDSSDSGGSAEPVPMADYGWSFRRYNPNSTTTEEFVDGIIEAIRPTAIRSTAQGTGYSCTTNSTRRFAARPPGVSFVATGRSAP